MLANKPKKKNKNKNNLRFKKKDKIRSGQRINSMLVEKNVLS